MAKQKTAYFCQNCGSQYPKWMGRCTSCNEWNTIVEERIQTEEKKAWKDTAGTKRSARPVTLSEIVCNEEERLQTGNGEFDTVMGGGIVRGSITLLGGEPGIGKSTLLLQIALSLTNRVLYVSGEESETQLKMRASRIGLDRSNCLVLTGTNTQLMFETVREVQPELVVVDSIQTLHTDAIESSAGSLSQLRECTAELMLFAKETNTPVILIGHITKDGAIAGPKILEHMVDVVLQFEGDRNHTYRLLRAHKNRFGSTSELGIYEMKDTGLREVQNPSEVLISEKEGTLSGTAISATLEGMRPLMIEVQALVSTAVYGTPQRSATGYDLKRLHMLLAVLEKRAGFRLGAKDVFLNIAGGLKVDDPAIDLAVVAAILSSNEDEAVAQNYCFAAEIGLAGEVRPVQKVEQRILEAERLGFERIYISKYCKLPGKEYAIEVRKVSKVEDIYTQLLT